MNLFPKNLTFDESIGLLMKFLCSFSSDNLGFYNETPKVPSSVGQTPQNCIILKITSGRICLVRQWNGTGFLLCGVRLGAVLPRISQLTWLVS